MKRSFLGSIIGLSLVAIVQLSLSMPTFALPECTPGQDPCSIDLPNGNLTEFCCPVTAMCVPEAGCVDRPQPPPCNSQPTCGRECTSEADCAEGYTCTFDPLADPGDADTPKPRCMPSFTEGATPEFRCSYHYGLPQVDWRAYLASAAILVIVIGRGRKRSAEREKRSGRPTRPAER